MTLTHNALRILHYLTTIHAINPRTEVSLIELERELEIEAGEVRISVETLVAQGLVQADLFPVNVWVQITEEGLARSEGTVP